MALSVPLSRFTSRVGGGSAFFVRPLVYVMITRSAGYMVSGVSLGSCTEPVAVGITGFAASSPFLAGHSERPAASAPMFFQSFGFHFYVCKS